MFSLGKLKLKNWCQHAEKEVTFTPGTNGIIGANGCGKSNILAAAFTMLTGKTLSDTLPEAINYDSDSTSNELTFAIDGTQGVIKRKYTATRKEGNPNNRDGVKSAASMKYGKEKTVKGVSATNKALDGLAGFSAQMLQTHVFITQDTMSELLFQPAQERLKSFMALIPDLNRAEKMRAMLLAEASLFPDLELAVSSASYEEQVKACELVLHSMEADYNTLLTAMGGIDADAAQAVIDAYNRGASVDIDTLKARAATAQAEYDNKLVEQGETDMLVQQLRESMPGLETPKDRLDNLKATLATADSHKRSAARKQELEASLNKLLPEIGARQAPVSQSTMSDDVLATAREATGRMNAEAATHRKVLSVLEAGGECPTCGNQFKDPAQEKAEHERWLTELVAECDSLIRQIATEEAVRRGYDEAVAEHKLWINTAEQQLLSIQKELESISLPDIDIPEDLTLLSREIEVLESRIDQLGKAENHSTVIAASIDGTSRILSGLEEQIEKANELLVGMPTQAQREEAATKLQLNIKYTSDKARLEGSIEAKKAELSSLVEARDKAKAMEERGKAVTQWKHMLDSARNTLHRDQLPEEVLASYIDSLEGACNKFLGMFGNPFAVMIGRGMDIRCTHPNGYVASARRLSAGQKCVLSVAMRFAINELFAGNFGLIILDEPTAFMDDDNIEYMRELISYIRGISQSTGIQTIIITHHKELISSFDNVINV